VPELAVHVEQAVEDRGEDEVGMTLFCQFSFNTSQFFIQPRSLAQQLLSPLVQALVPLPCPVASPRDQL